MINPDTIKYCKECYYIPGRNAPLKVSILELINFQFVKVKFSKNHKHSKAFIVPIDYVYYNKRQIGDNKLAFSSLTRYRNEHKDIDYYSYIDPKKAQLLPGVNIKGMALVDPDDIRMLISYGLNLKPNSETRKYAVIDNAGNIYAGEKYDLGADEIASIVQDLRINKPLHLPDFAEGLYAPNLYGKCLEVYNSFPLGTIKNPLNLYKKMLSKFGYDFCKTAHYNYCYLLRNELESYIKPKTIKEILMEMFNEIIKEKEYGACRSAIENSTENSAEN